MSNKYKHTIAMLQARWRLVVAALVLGICMVVIWIWKLRCGGRLPQYHWVPALAANAGEIRNGGLRLESCNVQGLPWLAQYDKIERYLRHCRRHADVVVLQELFTPRAIRAVRRVLHGWTLLLPLPMCSGLCVATRLPAHTPQLLHFNPCSREDCLVAKGAMALQLAVCDPPLRVVTAHLQNQNRAAVVPEQLRQLGAWLENDDVPTVVVGDFNAPPEQTHAFMPSRCYLLSTHTSTHQDGEELDYGWCTSDVEATVQASRFQVADHTPLQFNVTI